MPLVIAGLTTGREKRDDEQKEDDQQKDGHTSGQGKMDNEYYNTRLCGKPVKEQDHTEAQKKDIFCECDPPESYRVVRPGQMVTKDHKPERLNVHVGEDGKVSHCLFG